MTKCRLNLRVPVQPIVKKINDLRPGVVVKNIFSDSETFTPFPFHFKLFYPFYALKFEEQFKCSAVGTVQFPLQMVFPGYTFARIKLSDIQVHHSHLPTASRGKYLWVRFRKSSVASEFTRKQLEYGSKNEGSCNLVLQGMLKISTKYGYAELQAGSVL